MKILLDECVPKRLGRLLSEHDVVTTPQAGWAGITNGELLQRASMDFDVFVTVDRNLVFNRIRRTCRFRVLSFMRDQTS